MEKIDITYLNQTCETLIENQKLPLGYFFVKEVKIRRHNFSNAESEFYNVEQYSAGSFYKPISFKLKILKKP
jgi:hypothetical protein